MENKSVQTLKKLIEKIAEERNISPKIVEKALKDSIATAIKKAYRLKGSIHIEFTDEGIKAYLVVPEEEIQVLPAGLVKHDEERKFLSGTIVGVLDRKNTIRVKTKQGIFTIPVKNFKQMKNKYERGERITIKLVPLDISQIDYLAAKAARETFFKELNQAIKEKTFRELKELEGDLVFGIVRKTSPDGNIIVDLGKGEAVLQKNEQIPGDNYQPNDRIKALLWKVEKRRGKPLVLLSRTHPLFLRRLLEKEISEIERGIIEIKKIVREPGYRAKVVVFSKDATINPVSLILGVKGERVIPISEELRGEKIDVVKFSEDFKEFVKNAFSPAKVYEVLEFPEKRKVKVIVDDKDLPLAIGKRGLNVKLINKLIGYSIDVIPKSQYEKESSS